jgi:hypothetical protein
MTLLLSVPSGPVDAQVALNTGAGDVLCQVVDVAANAPGAVFSFEDDFDYVSTGTLTDPVAIPLAGQNVPTGSGNWFMRALTAAGLLSLQQLATTPGWITVGTSTTINSLAYWQRGSGTTVAFNWIGPAQIAQVTMLERLSSNTLVRVQTGITTSPSSLAPADAAMFVVDTTLSLNWLCVCRRAGAQTLVDSGVPATAAVDYHLEIRQAVAGTWTFHVGVSGGAVQQVASIATNTPLAACNVHFLVQTLTGSSRSLLVDLFGLTSKRLTR